MDTGQGNVTDHEGRKEEHAELRREAVVEKPDDTFLGAFPAELEAALPEGVLGGDEIRTIITP